MNSDPTQEPKANENCTHLCKSAYDECVQSGVTADPCHDLLDRCKAACTQDDSVRGPSHPD